MENGRLWSGTGIFFLNFIILYSAVLGHDSLSTNSLSWPPRTPECPVQRGFSSPHCPPDCKSKKTTQKTTQKATHLILLPRRLARPVLILLILTVLPRYGPADTRASQEVQHNEVTNNSLQGVWVRVRVTRSDYKRRVMNYQHMGRKFLY